MLSGAIHQPHYLPWAGLLDKWDQADLLILLDDAQFSRGGWHNRNYVLTADGRRLLTVPVRHNRLQPLNAVTIDYRQPWDRSHVRTLAQAYARAPFPGFLQQFTAEVYGRRWTSLGDLAVQCMLTLGELTGIQTPTVPASTLGVSGRRSQRLADLCTAVVPTLTSPATAAPSIWTTSPSDRPESASAGRTSPTPPGRNYTPRTATSSATSARSTCCSTPDRTLPPSCARPARPPRSRGERPGTVAIWRTHVPTEVRRRVQAETDRVLRSGRMVDGPLTQRLEDSIGAAFDRHAIAVSSGMDALELLLQTHQAQGREVLIPANCFPSIPALALHLGAHPRPVPVDPIHLCIAKDVAAHASDHLRPPIVMWIHHAGMVAPYARARIAALRRTGCTVIEDCAYLLPGERPAGGPGTWGDAAVFSFAPTKPLSGTGGGLVLTSDGAAADAVRSRRSHSGQEAGWTAGDSFHRGRTITEAAATLAYNQWQQRTRARTALRHLAGLYLQTFAEPSCGALPVGRDPKNTWGRQNT